MQHQLRKAFATKESKNQHLLLLRTSESDPLLRPGGYEYEQCN